jgi:hypothetical protein
VIDPVASAVNSLKHLEDALAMADELEDGTIGYLIEGALDEGERSNFGFPTLPAEES